MKIDLQDLVSIITCFSAKIYGARGGEKVKKTLEELEKKGRRSTVKITMKAVLINASNDQSEVIDNMMAVFCTAIRYAFKRIVEGMNIKILEKEVAHKYNLNIRQSKDAVESARQTIV